MKIPMPPGGYPEPSHERPTGTGLIGRAGVIPACTIWELGTGQHSRLCYEAHMRFMAKQGRPIIPEPEARPSRPEPFPGSLADLFPILLVIVAACVAASAMLGYWASN